MSPEGTERRLAAIMFTDIVGSTAATARSETTGLGLRDRHRKLVRAQVGRYRGRFVEAPGDESLSAFDSALNAVNCALTIQQELENDPDLALHIGVHLGEIVFRGEEVFGDGVNLTRRICSLAPPGETYVSSVVADALRGQQNIESSPRGEHKLKGVERPVAVSAVSGTAAQPSAAARISRRGVLVRSLALGALATLLTIVAFAWWNSRRDPAAPPLTAIAVIPFDDMSPGGDHAWLANGMTEELIAMLSRVESFRVPARVSTRLMKEQNADLRTIGEKLGTGTVVEGSVRRSGDSLRITAQLIRVDDGYHLWDGNYGGKLEDVFELQEKAARQIAEAIRVELGVRDTWSSLEQSRYLTRDVRAYELVKKAVDAGELLTEEGFRAEIDFSLQALEIDPDFGQAHAQLAWGYFLLWEVSFDRREETRSKASASAHRALELDPTNGAAHVLLAHLSMREGDWSGAEARLASGVEAAPRHGPLRGVYGVLLAYAGRFDEAAIQLRRCVDLDPSFAWALGFLHFSTGDYDAAIEVFERALEAGFPVPPRLLIDAYYLNGMPAEALEAMVRYAAPPEAETVLRQVYDRAGMKGAFRALTELNVSQSGGKRCSNHPVGLAQELAVVGDADRMFECLEVAVQGQYHSVDEINVHPYFDPYRSDPRFDDLLRRIGFPES